jgi:UDP-N-acetyl-D-glucosamine dehydrogenase
MDLLRAQGAELSYSDPHVPVLPNMRRYDLPRLKSVELTPERLAQQDCVLIATDHSAFDYDTIVRHAPLVVDTRNATKDVTDGREKIVKA